MRRTCPTAASAFGATPAVPLCPTHNGHAPHLPSCTQAGLAPLPCSPSSASPGVIYDLHAGEHMPFAGNPSAAAAYHAARLGQSVPACMRLPPTEPSPTYAPDRIDHSPRCSLACLTGSCAQRTSTAAPLMRVPSSLCRPAGAASCQTYPRSRTPSRPGALHAVRHQL